MTKQRLTNFGPHSAGPIATLLRGFQQERATKWILLTNLEKKSFLNSRLLINITILLSKTLVQNVNPVENITKHCCVSIEGGSFLKVGGQKLFPPFLPPFLHLSSTPPTPFPPFPSYPSFPFLLHSRSWTSRSFCCWFNSGTDSGEIWFGYLTNGIQL